MKEAVGEWRRLKYSISQKLEGSSRSFSLRFYASRLQALDCSAHSTNNKSGLAVAIGRPSHIHMIQHHLHPTLNLRA